MKLIFSGTVSSGDSSRVSYCREHKSDEGCLAACDDKDGALWIGDHDVVSEVGDVTWAGPVNVAIASDFLLGNTTYAGALKIAEGWGYSEYTPMDSDELLVGPHDLLKIIGELEGRDVTVWFADEPLNILEGAVING